MRIAAPRFHCDVCRSDIYEGKMYTSKDTDKLLQCEVCCSGCYKMITAKPRHKKGRR